MNHELFHASGILLLLLLVALLSGCALTPPSPEGLVDSVKAQGCDLKGLNTSDSFSWRFLSIHNTRTTGIECHKVPHEKD